MKKLILASLLAGSLSVIFAADPVPALKPAAAPAKANSAAGSVDTLFVDRPIARGKGFELKRSQLEEAFTAYKAFLASQGRTLPEERRQEVEAGLLDRMIVTQILLTKANAEEKAKAKTVSEGYVSEARTNYPSQEIFEQQLKLNGTTLEQFRRRLLEQSTSELVLDREVKSKIKYTDADAKKFYDENPGLFEEGDKVRASHILLMTIDPATHAPLSPEKKKEKKDLIDKLKARADKGEDFKKLATEFTDDTASKEKGGEYTFGHREMVPEFEAAAFSMKTNQVSDVIETQYGYHIIKLWEKFPAQKLDFAKVLPEIKEHQIQLEMQKQMPEYFEKLKKEANAELIDASGKAIPAISQTPPASPAPTPVAPPVPK